jgi:ribonuclease P protein component
MLSAENRLKKERDFERVFKEGKAWRGELVFLKWLGNGLDASRFGFIVSRKVSKKAIVRNKLKRRLRQIARTRMSELKKGVDIVVVARPGLESKNFAATKEIINELFRKAGLLEKV